MMKIYLSYIVFNCAIPGFRCMIPSQSLLKELKIPLPTCAWIWCDNMSAGSLASNLVCHARNKHLEIDLHFVRDKVIQQDLEVRYVPSCDQLADCLTKDLAARSKLGSHSHPFF